MEPPKPPPTSKKLEGKLRRENDDLRKQIQAQDEELDRLRKSLQARFSEIASVTRILVENIENKEKNDLELEKEIHSLRRLIAKRDNSIQKLRFRIERFKKSVSWRVTWPIRAFGRIFPGSKDKESK